jgi:hypothetical protein
MKRIDRRDLLIGQDSGSGAEILGWSKSKRWPRCRDLLDLMGSMGQLHFVEHLEFRKSVLV